MGGAGGHMSHPYDLDEVKNGADLIKILMGIPKHLAMDAVNATIKLDGSNNSVKVIDRRGKLEFALDRGAMGLGKGELDYQGLTPDDYEARQLNVGLQSSTNILLGILNDALETANIEPELYALGLIDKEGNADYSKFLNTEFYDKDNPNSIAYDIGNFIAFHGVYQFYEKFHRRGTPDKPNPGAKQVRGGLPRPTYVDQKDDKEKYKKVTSKRVPYDPKALASLVKKVKPFAKKAGFEMVGPAAAKQKDTKMVKETIADMKASLAKPITIQISKDRSETKSLEEWLRQSVNPLTTKYELPDGRQVYFGCQDCIRLSSGVKTNPYNKEKIYKPIMINKEPIVDYFENSDGQINAMAALNSAILFHATRLLGQDIKNHLTTDIFGDVTDHEGAVVRNYGSEDFKITGEFMMDETGGFAQKRVPTVSKDEFLQEDENVDMSVVTLDNEDADPVGEEAGGRTIALVPGAFKPPTRGHLGMVEEYLNKDQIDQVVVLVSQPTKNVSKRNIPGGREVTAEDSIKIWKKLTDAYPEDQISIQKSPMASPFQAALDYIGTAPAGSNVVLGASEKGDAEGTPDWHRWLGTETYANEGVNVFYGDSAREINGGADFAASVQKHSPHYMKQLSDLQESELVQQMPSVKSGKDPADFHASDMRYLISQGLGGNDNAYPLLEDFVGGGLDEFDLAMMFSAPAKEKKEISETSQMGAGMVGGFAGASSESSIQVRSAPGFPEEDEDDEDEDETTQENIDLSMVDEIMGLIIQRGIRR